ncbi:MAG: GTP 3',8-cyclase MoaA [Planctomycetota bacterium]|nr:MAG: GTP 3',8-cyclase MoaA [Planctomycetota bacterium]
MKMHIDYLRVSVTDRCNLRCIYCHCLDDCDFIDRREILRFEEIRRIVRLFAECGIRKVRLTGGEPLIRRDVIELIRGLAAVSNIEDLALTTNGVLLEQMAEQLKAAGLMRVNVSLDSVQRENYKRITGFDLLGKVMTGIRKAIEVGLSPVRINAIILRGVNELDVGSLAELSMEMPVAVRFIEYCPTHKGAVPEEFFVPNSQVRRSIEDRFGRLAAAVVPNSNGPAVYFKIRGGAGSVGFISGRTKVFCQSCNRLRLTSDGKVMPCLYSANSYDLKGLIRGGAGDEQILALLKKIIVEKRGYTRLNSFTEEFSMRNVGG